MLTAAWLGMESHAYLPPQCGDFVWLELGLCGSFARYHNLHEFIDSAALLHLEGTLGTAPFASYSLPASSSLKIPEPWGVDVINMSCLGLITRRCPLCIDWLVVSGPGTPQCPLCTDWLMVSVLIASHYKGCLSGEC